MATVSSLKRALHVDPNEPRPIEAVAQRCSVKKGGFF